MTRSTKAVIVGRQLVNADSSYRDLSFTPVVLLYLKKVEKNSISPFCDGKFVTTAEPLLRVLTHIEKRLKVYFFIKRLRHTDAHFFFVIICLNYQIIYIL